MNTDGESLTHRVLSLAHRVAHRLTVARVPVTRSTKYKLRRILDSTMKKKEGMRKIPIVDARDKAGSERRDEERKSV